MCKIEFKEQLAVQDGTRCYGCGQSYEVMLLIPASGNKRRFARHYRCDCCEKVFAKYDFGFLAGIGSRLLLKLVKSVFTKLLSAFNPAVDLPPESKLAFCSGTQNAVTRWCKKTSFRTVPIAERNKMRAESMRVWTVAQSERMSVPVHLA